MTIKLSKEEAQDILGIALEAELGLKLKVTIWHDCDEGVKIEADEISDAEVSPSPSPMENKKERMK